MTYELVYISVQSAFDQGAKRNPKRKSVASNKELTRRIDKLERTYDGQFKMVIEAIRRLMRPSVRKRKPTGFRAKIPKK